ncbi:hypothetical protein ACOMHN_004730 [Nucella lapillus]
MLQSPAFISSDDCLWADREGERGSRLSVLTPCGPRGSIPPDKHARDGRDANGTDTGLGLMETLDSPSPLHTHRTCDPLPCRPSSAQQSSPLTNCPASVTTPEEAGSANLSLTSLNLPASPRQRSGLPDTRNKQLVYRSVSLQTSQRGGSPWKQKRDGGIQWSKALSVDSRQVTGSTTTQRHPPSVFLPVSWTRALVTSRRGCETFAGPTEPSSPAGVVASLGEGLCMSKCYGGP